MRVESTEGAGTRVMFTIPDLPEIQQSELSSKGMATMKVLIVDDEVIIRNGLSTVINWADNGFTVLTPAASAEEALQRIPVEMPEIIFTDIRMTGLSGLDMAHEVKQQYPEIEIIVISGYDEFSYAQQAMREGVSDYLLKTSRPGEIIEAAVQARAFVTAQAYTSEGKGAGVGSQPGFPEKAACFRHSAGRACRGRIV